MKRLSGFAAGVGSLLILAFFAAPPVFGQHSHSGGRPSGGGGYHGGPPGGGGYHGGHGGYHGGYRGGYGGYHGYRGGYYGGYWGYPGGWGWGPGWGWWGGWGPAGYWSGWYGAQYPGYFVYAPGQGGAVYNWTIVKTDVSPEEARLYLDGRYIGTADDFDGYPDFLYLTPGKYQLEFKLDGFEPQTVTIEARASARYKLDNKLKKIPGAKQYGSYDTPEPEGGLQRYWTKNKNGSGDVPLGAESGTATDWRNSQAPGPPGTTGAEPPAGTPEPAEGSAISVAPPPAARARIQFRIEPGDAVVYLDDHFAGTGEELSSLNRGLIVAPGAHKIVVSRPGYETQASQVEVTAERPQLVEITLERP
jgi:hypothetical protein